MINLSSIDITNKNLVIRVDMNVPIKDGNILDATRIESCIPTINYVLENYNDCLKISNNAFNIIKNNYTWDIRSKNIIKFLNNE